MTDKINLCDEHALKMSITTDKPWGREYKDGEVRKQPPTVHCVFPPHKRGTWGTVKKPTKDMLDAQAQYNADEKRIKEEQKGPNYQRKVDRARKQIEDLKKNIKKWAKLGNLDLDKEEKE